MSDISNAQKEEVRSLLNNPLLQLALQNALADVWNGLQGASTLEGAALAYKQMEGATSVLSKLHSNVDIKKSFAVTPRRLKHTTP